MRTTCTALFLALFAVTAQAQQGGTAQQRCNAEANQKSLKGDERQKFVSSCLSTLAQQEKMKTCSQRAGERKLKSDARKKFMTQCLRG